MKDLTSEWVSFERYCQLLDELPVDDITMYHRKPWLDIISNSFDAQICAVHTVTAGGDSLALTPFVMKKKLFIRMYGTPLKGMFTEHLGPLFVRNLNESLLKSIIESQHNMIAFDGHYIEWGTKGGYGILPSWGKNLQSCCENRYTLHPTIQIDLSQGEEKVWKNFQGRARNMIRKAEKYGVVASIVAPSDEWIEAYYKMLSTTFERQGRKVPHPLSFYKGLINLYQDGNVLFADAKRGEKMIAAGIFLMDQNRMLYLSGTASEEGMKYAGASLLQWCAIREAIKSNITAYDMGGLGVPSIDKFKRSFGGHEIVHHGWCYRSKLFGLFEPVGQWALRKGLISY